MCSVLLPTVTPGVSYPLQTSLITYLWFMLPSAGVCQYTSLTQASGEFVQRLAVRTGAIVYEYLEPWPLWSLSHINSAEKFAF